MSEARQLTASADAWKFRKPFRITGYTFTDVDQHQLRVTYVF